MIPQLTPVSCYCVCLCTPVSFSVPGTNLSHSLVYNHLYFVARRSELRLLLLLSPSHLSLSLVFPLVSGNSGNSGVWNSHAPSHSEIRDPWGIPQGTGQYPESAPVIRIRYYFIYLLQVFSYLLDPFRIQFVTEIQSYTGDKGPNTHWVHGKNIEGTVNMWLQCAQWSNVEYILNILRYVTQICPVGTYWVHFECAQPSDSNVPSG